MRFIIPVIILISIDLYAFQAIKTLSESWSLGTKSIINGIYWMIPIALVAFLLAYTNGYFTAKGNLFSILRAIFIIAYLSKLFMCGILLIDDIRRFGLSIYASFSDNHTFDYSRSRFLNVLALAFGTLPFMLLSYGIIRNRHRYQVFKESIRLPQLPKSLEGLRIVQISDIHSGSFTLKEPVKAAIDLINQQKPDLVFFTGDLVNSIADEMDDFVDVFDKIEAKYGVYSIFGNHDYGDYARWPSQAAKVQNLEKLKNIHRQMGWDLLLNENRILTIKEQKIAIIGVENYSASRHFSKYGDLTKAYQGAENADLKLLLSHDPTHWEDQVIKGFQDIAITFSGHTHGMQFGFEIPGFIKWSPAKYIYKQWAGLYQQGTQYLYVNRGLGYLGYPGRVGILPEITVFDLKPTDTLS